jgi:hypothetical protein
MVRARRGASTFGCLFTVLVLVTAGYFGLKIGNVFWKSYEFEDTMKQQARFAEMFTDDQIRKRIIAWTSTRSDSLHTSC